LFFTGDLVPASEFCRLGAIEEIVEDEPVPDRAMAFARTLATKSPIALRLAEESILRPWPPSWRSAGRRGPADKTPCAVPAGRDLSSSTA
jgi:enoyl-CoA hydratase/carnithine racemase